MTAVKELTSMLGFIISSIKKSKTTIAKLDSLLIANL